MTVVDDQAGQRRLYEQALATRRLSDILGRWAGGTWGLWDTGSEGTSHLVSFSRLWR